MKFLENCKLEALNSALSAVTGECRLDTRVESYSCKMVKDDKRLWKEMLQAEGPGTSPHDPQPLSPPVIDDPLVYPNFGGSPGTSRYLSVRSRHRSRSMSGSDQDGDNGPVLCDSISRKMLFDLSACLNTSFTDYDFTDAKGETFSRVHSLDAVIRSADTQLAAVIEQYGRIKGQVWQILDEEIQLRECNIYSYNPDYSAADPFSEDGCIWSFNYFFYNKRLKRILLVACRALSLDVETDEPMWHFDEDE